MSTLDKYMLIIKYDSCYASLGLLTISVWGYEGVGQICPESIYALRQTKIE